MSIVELCGALACKNPIEEGTKYCSDECKAIQGNYESYLKLCKEVEEYEANVKQGRKNRARMRILHQRIKTYEKKMDAAKIELLSLLKGASDSSKYYFMTYAKKRDFVAKLDEKFGKINWRY